MNTRNLTPVVAIVLVFVAGGTSLVFAEPVYIYGRDDFGLPIPANPDDTKGWMEDAIIQVPDHFTIYDLDVGITLTHTSVFDLQLFLESPSGTKVCLNMYSFTEFFTGENYQQTIFDDEAETPIEEALPPFTGRFRPEAGYRLESFDSQDAYGVWRLQIYDAFYYNTGTLNSCKIMITTPEPATTLLLTLGAGLITLFRRPRNH